MSNFIIENYQWFKALHIIAVIAWMAGLLYLPRLFVYHARPETTSEMASVFCVMEARLLRFIMNPAMMVVWVIGGLMLFANPGVMMAGGWMHAKLGLVVILTAIHMVFAKWRKNLRDGTNTRSSKFYKIANEIPTILMIVIIILVIVRPF